MSWKASNIQKQEKGNSEDLSFKASVYVTWLSFGVHLLVFMKLGFNMQFLIHIRQRNCYDLLPQKYHWGDKPSYFMFSKYHHQCAKHAFIFYSIYCFYYRGEVDASPATLIKKAQLSPIQMNQWNLPTNLAIQFA